MVFSRLRRSQVVAESTYTDDDGAPIHIRSVKGPKLHVVGPHVPRHICRLLYRGAGSGGRWELDPDPWGDRTGVGGRKLIDPDFGSVQREDYGTPRLFATPVVWLYDRFRNLTNLTQLAILAAILGLALAALGFTSDLESWSRSYPFVAGLLGSATAGLLGLFMGLLAGPYVYRRYSKALNRVALFEQYCYLGNIAGEVAKHLTHLYRVSDCAPYTPGDYLEAKANFATGTYKYQKRGERERFDTRLAGVVHKLHFQSDYLYDCAQGTILYGQATVVDVEDILAQCDFAATCADWNALSVLAALRAENLSLLVKLSNDTEVERLVSLVSVYVDTLREHDTEARGWMTTQAPVHIRQGRYDACGRYPTSWASQLRTAALLAQRLADLVVRVSELCGRHIEWDIMRYKDTPFPWLTDALTGLFSPPCADQIWPVVEDREW